jgi:hypothetical protein
MLIKLLVSTSTFVVALSISTNRFDISVAIYWFMAIKILGISTSYLG